jgi:excinuclease UvrABC nuclease subunit
VSAAAFVEPRLRATAHYFAPDGRKQPRKTPVHDLGSGLIKEIGPSMAERIVDHFGEASLEVIEQAPGRLVEVELSQ